MKGYLVMRATIEYSHCYVEAESEDAAVEEAKKGGVDWKFDSYSGDGELEALTNGQISEYDVECEDEEAPPLGKNLAVVE